MRGLSRYESAVVLRYGKVDTTTFTRKALGILESRTGGYRGYGVLGALILPASIELTGGADRSGLRLRLGPEAELGDGFGAEGLTAGPAPAGPGAGPAVGSRAGLGAGLGVGLEVGPGAGPAAGGTLAVDVTIESDARAGLRLTGIGATPLPFRRGTVDAVRCATFVFGAGEIDGAEPTVEFGVTVRSDAGLQCAYAYGTLEDPYSPRWEISVRPVAVVARDRGLPESAAIGQIAAHCLAG